MANFKTFLETVDRPKSGDEQAFLDKHVIVTQEHPAATEFQFKGTKPPKAKRKADYAPGEDASVYEAAEVHTKRADKEAVIVRAVDPKTGASKAKVVQRRAGEIKIGEEVELEESITKLSDARLKFHATKNVPHGSYSRKEIDAEHKRRMKTDGASYASVKPSLNEDADLDEKVKNPYAVGMAAAMKAAGDTPPLKKSTIVKGHEIAKSIKKEAMDPVGKHDADIDNDGDTDKSDKYLIARRKAISKALRKEDLDEAVEVRHDRYMRSHGKKARDSGHGSSNWMFTHKSMGDVDYNNSKEVHNARGSFSDAKKSAQKWAKEHGHHAVYVMEEVEQIDELSPNTLHSYIKKAAPDVAARTMSAVASNQSAQTKKHASKLGKRISGITSASGRLADKANSYQYEEVEQIDEISSKLLRKAADAADHNHQAQIDMQKEYEPNRKTPAPSVQAAGARAMKFRVAALRKDYTTKKEEFEQLDEIGDTAAGRKALKAVIARAPEKAANARLKSDLLGRRQFDPDVSHQHSELYGKASEKHYKKYQNTVKSAARAVDRLTKEEVEQIDELSKKTLGSYVKKASERVAYKANHAGEIEGRGDSNITPAARATLKKLNRKTANSLAGISRATNRLTKEEVEQIDEAFKVGSMKLKDGSSVTITKESAEVLNSLFNQLNGANKSKMEERMMSGKKGFQEILSFAENI